MTPEDRAGAGVDLSALVHHLDEYLEASRGDDFCPNGLQVEGRPWLRRVVTGVSACGELFEIARQSGADAVIVHHGLFWHGAPLPLVGVQYRRIAELIRGDLSLIAYHLPLDRHPEVGNNAVAARRLGLTDLEPFAEHRGAPIGWKGRLGAALSADQLLGEIESLFGQPPLAFAHGPSRVFSVGIVSGAGGRCVHDAIAADLDVFITGEADEWSMNVAKEAGIHFVAAGHYATERLGIQALGARLQDRFGLAVEFVDIPNPV